MPGASSVFLFAAVSLANYYATTFSIWLAHFVWHLDWPILRNAHARGHHLKYPHSGDCRSETPRYSLKRYNGVIALIPCLLVQAAGAFLCLPLWLFLACVVQIVLITGTVNYLHTQCHLDVSPLDRFRWFAAARGAHDQHHDRDANFMVGDHFWDRRLGTYGVPSPMALRQV